MFLYVFTLKTNLTSGNLPYLLIVTSNSKNNDKNYSLKQF